MRKSIISALAVLLLAVCLIGCSTAWQKTDGVEAVAEYNLVGYKYGFALDGNTVTFDYVDAVGDDTIPLIASTLGGVLPGYCGYEYPEGGVIVLKTKANVTEAQFGAFVEAAEALIYDTIY